MTSTQVTYCLHCLESWTYDTYERGRNPHEWVMYLNDVLLDHLLENEVCMEAVRWMLKLDDSLTAAPEEEDVA